MWQWVIFLFPFSSQQTNLFNNTFKPIFNSFSYLNAIHEKYLSELQTKKNIQTIKVLTTNDVSKYCSHSSSLSRLVEVCHWSSCDYSSFTINVNSTNTQQSSKPSINQSKTHEFNSLVNESQLWKPTLEHHINNHSLSPWMNRQVKLSSCCCNLNALTMNEWFIWSESCCINI